MVTPEPRTQTPEPEPSESEAEYTTTTAPAVVNVPPPPPLPVAPRAVPEALKLNTLSEAEINRVAPYGPLKNDKFADANANSNPSHAHLKPGRYIAPRGWHPLERW